MTCEAWGQRCALISPQQRSPGRQGKLLPFICDTREPSPLSHVTISNDKPPWFGNKVSLSCHCEPPSGGVAISFFWRRFTQIIYDLLLFHFCVILINQRWSASNWFFAPLPVRGEASAARSSHLNNGHRKDRVNFSPSFATQENLTRCRMTQKNRPLVLFSLSCHCEPPSGGAAISLFLTQIYADFLRFFCFFYYRFSLSALS